MGNAALKQRFVNLLEKHAPLLVKDLPYEDLLALSVLGVSARLERLELQERVLENLGIFVPFQIDRACLEEVELSLSGLQLQISAARFALRCRLKDLDQTADEMRGAAATELPGDLAGQPLLMKCLSSVKVTVQDIEIILQMHDAEARPWNLGVVMAAQMDSLPLQMLQRTQQLWHVELQLQELRVICARAEQTELQRDRGLLFGPCDLQVQVAGSKKIVPDEDHFRLCLMVENCVKGLRLNQFQLALLARLGHVCVLWDALLRSLQLDDPLRTRIQELLELIGQEAPRCASISLLGAFPIEVVDESGEDDGPGPLAAASVRLMAYGEDPSPMELHLKVQTEPMGFGLQVCMSNFAVELNGAQKVRLVDHVGDFFADLGAHPDPPLGRRKSVVRLGALRLRVDPEEAMALLMLLEIFSLSLLDPELYGDPWPVPDEFEGAELRGWAHAQVEPIGVESDWPLLQVSCTDPVTLLLPGTEREKGKVDHASQVALQPLVVSFCFASEDVEDLRGMRFQLRDVTCFSSSPSVSSASHLARCETISISLQQQDLVVLAPHVQLTLHPLELALVTRHVRRWGTVRQDAAPLWERRSSLSSSFGSCDAGLGSPRDWHVRLQLQLPELDVQLASNAFPVLCASVNWQTTMELDGQLLLVRQSCDSLRVADPISERELVRLQQPSQLVVNVPFDSIKEQVQWRGRLAPSFISVDCIGLSKILEYLKELQEVFGMLGLEDVDPILRGSLLSDWENCLQNVDLHVTCSQLNFFLPSSSILNASGILFSCGAWCSFRQLHGHLALTKLSACEATWAELLQLGGTWQTSKDAQILHPCRLKADVDLALEPPSLTGRVDFSPISVSLKTEHVPLFRRIWHYLHALDGELAGFGEDFDWTSSSSPQKPRSSEYSEGHRTWQARSAELRQLGEVLQELFPSSLVLALRHSAHLLKTCRLQLDVELGAMHLGLVQSSTDAELCVVLVEDVGFSVDRAALVAQGFSSPLSAPSPASSCLSPARPQGPRRREHLAGHVILSVDITSTELARSSTLLEPVCFMFNLFKGIKHQPSTCKVSWVNLNLSSSLIDTLVSLYHDAMERTAGASSPSPSRPDDVVEPERRERLGLLPPTETLEATRAASAADLEASAAMLVARSSEESLNSQGRSLKRQVSISSRQPQLRVVNLLGQDIALDLLYSADGRRSKEFPIFSGSSRIVTMPWCGCGAPRAGSGWMAKLQLQQIPDAEVFLHLTATSAVKSVSAKPSKPSRTQSMSSSFLGSQMRCYSADTSGSNLDLSYKLTSLPESWILVRTEVGDKLHELDVHFSSVLFVENRTALSLSVAPYGTPPEGFLELPARSEPQPIPLAWLAHSSLWLGVTEELKMPSLNSSGSSLSFGAVLSGNTDPDKRGWMRAQRRRGILQPMIGKTTWQAIRRYRSMVANDYFLRSRMLHLSDRMGESCASLCATVCGVSADLQASLQALIFSVALEPAAQICNRLPCPMTLASLDGPLVIPPGEDVDIVKPSQLHITLEVAPCTGAVDEEPLTLHLETPLWADRLPREKHQKRLHFSEVNVQGKEADQIAKLMVSLETEPGLTMSEYWSPLQVRQYSPRSLRLVFFTQYWLLNRRSDCRVCLPQPELGATRATGVAKFASRRPAGSVDSSKRLALMQYDCNTLRMVSESLVRRGKIRVGLCDQRYNANGESLVPVTEPIRINQPTAGSATAPRSAFNPVQRCFGYTVRPAPLPFHRTLLVEVVRRYTLLNHKEHVLYCFEKDTSTSFVALSANGSAAFDPQRSGPRAVAISGVAPQSAMLELLERRPRASTVPPDRREHGRDPPGRRSVTWATENWSEGEADVELGRCEDTEQQDFSSAPFVLESSRRSFQLMHLCDLSHWSAHALSASSSLARAEPLRPEPLPAPSGIGWAWCLTQVDTLVEQSSVVVRFSEPLRPQFRILNRTGHGLGLRQDCDRAPGFELAPEHRMSFCWFQPEGPLKLRLRLGAQEISYDVGTVQEHSPPLRVERPAGGTGSAHGDVSAFVGVVREEFLVQTKVVRGSREVHIHPHCLLKNAKGHALLVRSGHKNTEMVVPHEGSVCLQRESKASEQVVLEIATCVPGSSAHWSAPIMLTKSLAGQRGFVRHMKSGGSGMTSVFEITMVDVKKDPISDFLVVELRPYVKANCPYFFENVSQQVCSVSQLEGPDAGAPLDLFPGESAPFVPVGALICGQGTFPVRLAVLGAEDEIRYSTVIDIELPQEVVFGAMRVKVLKERPRHIVIRDAEIKPRKNSKGLKHHLPPFVFLQRMLGSKKPKPKPRPSPTARHLSPRRKTRMISPGLSPRRRRPTLPLQMLAGTPRLTAMPSTRSLTSRISKLRRSSLGIFWTIQGRKRCQRLRGTVLELYAQGAGVTLVDSTSLNEVAYFCADSLVVDMVKYEGAQRALEIKLGSLQLDVHDNSAGWRSNVMVRPKRSRLPARVREGRPFLDISATWLALERGAGFAAHLEVENLKIEMQPLELRLDTLSCFQLAIFGLDLLRRAEPLLAALPMFGHLRRQLKTRWRSDGEELLVASQGDGHDPVVGEPPCPEYDDFDVPTPVFIKELLVRRIQLFVSVRFNGKASASGNCSSEALQAVDIVLRKLIPFDVSQARLSLGPFFRRRPGAPAPKGCRLFRMLLLGEQQSDALLADEFLPHGFHELFSEASSAAGDAVLRQIPQFVGAQRLLGSPAHLWTELTQALHLAVFGLCSCSPWLLIAALLTVIAAVLESVEGIFMIIAKTSCRITAGTVPTGLRKEPSGFPGALMDLLWYGFPWHAQQIYRECRRQSHIAYSSHSFRVSMCCVLEGLWYCLFSILSSAFVIVAKLFQSLQLLCHTLAWYVCPERIAELGAPLSRRVGPLLFHLGSPLQYSHTVTSTMAVVHQTVRGTRLRDWRLQQLPDHEGSLLAVQGSGFYLVRSSALMACVPAREADVFLAWQAKGYFQKVELLVRPREGRAASAPFLLCFYGRNKSCKVLRLRSRRAAVMAFSFAQECVSSWAKSEVTPMAPETPKSRLLRRVHRSAAVRATG